jgi:hypothetical protein
LFLVLVSEASNTSLSPALSLRVYIIYIPVFLSYSLPPFFSFFFLSHPLFFVARGKKQGKNRGRNGVWKNAENRGEKWWKNATKEQMAEVTPNRTSRAVDQEADTQATIKDRHQDNC